MLLKRNLAPLRASLSTNQQTDSFSVWSKRNRATNALFFPLAPKIHPKIHLKTSTSIPPPIDIPTTKMAPTKPRTTPRALSARQSHAKGRLSKRTAFAREIVREVAG